MEASEPRGGGPGRLYNEPAFKPLQLGVDPFAARSGSNPIGQQIQTALADVLQHVGAQTPLVVVSGAPGTGKSWLLDKIGQACSAKGHSVRREDRGDLIDVALADTCDVLLIDEADSVPPELLAQLMEAGGFRKRRRSIVLMCLPGAVSRFDRVGRNPPLVQILPLSDEEAQGFLETAAKSIGRSSLFTLEAAHLVIERSGGSPRLLRRNASLAFFTAVSEGASWIGAEHVSQILEANSFATATKNPNEGKSWTTSDPSNHSALYQKSPASQPASVESAQPAAAAPSGSVAETPAGPASNVDARPRSTPPDKSTEPKRQSRKLSEFTLYSSSANDYQAALERVRTERNASELEKIKRRETNRIFYHSWRFGK